jgi:hypothetical protein
MTVLAVGIIVISWCILAIWSIGKARNDAERARQLIHDLAQLRVGQSTIDDVIGLSTKYGGKVGGMHHTFDTVKNPTSINPQTSEVSFGFSNRWQHLLCRSPLIGLTVQITVENGVDIKHLIYAEEYLHSKSITIDGFGVLLEEVRSGRQDNAVAVEMGRVYASATITTEATTAERTAMYDLNLICLSKLRGCNSSEEIAPGLSRLANHRGY